MLICYDAFLDNLNLPSKPFAEACRVLLILFGVAFFILFIVDYLIDNKIAEYGETNSRVVMHST